MQSLLTLGQNILALLTLQNILLFIACSLAGIIFGCLPGLTASIGIALLTGFTYGADTDTAMVMLMSIYVGAIYGGSISAVLIGIPGTGSAAATVLDGHVLARRGEAGKALSLATVASFIGTLFGMLCLALLTPLLLKLSLNFTSVEFTLLAIFGITICGSLTSAGEPVKGWISGFIGLFISAVGFDSIFSYPRFTYGSVPLLGGINFVPAMIGLFGLPAVFISLSGGKASDVPSGVEKRSGSVGTLLKKHVGLILKSGLIGSFVGTIPGVGEDVAAWLSYDTAKRSSKHPEEFGKGSYEGVIAAETANNACIGGAMIPLLSLGVPGSGPCAVLLGALTLHGIRTGPMLETANPGFILKISAIIILAALFMRFGGLLISRIAPKLLSVPSFILMPIVGVLCVVGSYAIYVTKFDIYSMFFMGLLGYVFDRLKVPSAPAVLGVILGSLLDSNLRRSLMAANGSLVNFFTRPIALILLVLIFFSVFSQTGVYRRFLGKFRRK
jgi:putative tricarboxylic transport membrane protein